MDYRSAKKYKKNDVVFTKDTNHKLIIQDVVLWKTFKHKKVVIFECFDVEENTVQHFTHLDVKN